MKTTPESPPLQVGWLVGTWEFTRSTAAIGSPFDVVYHFDRLGINYWELPFMYPTKRNQTHQLPYREQGDGFWLLWPNASRFHHCRQSFDEIVVMGVTGDHWWMRRLTKPTADLELFVNPDSGELIQLGNHGHRMGRHQLPP